MLRLRRAAPLAGLGTPQVSDEALAATPVGPQPLTDAELVKRLQQELHAARGTIGRLNEKLAERAASVPECSGCEGYRQVIAAMRKSAAADRKRITELQFADPAERARTIASPVPLPAET